MRRIGGKDSLLTVKYFLIFSSHLFKQESIDVEIECHSDPPLIEDWTNRLIPLDNEIDLNTKSEWKQIVTI